MVHSDTKLDQAASYGDHFSCGLQPALAKCSKLSDIESFIVILVSTNEFEKTIQPQLVYRSKNDFLNI